MTDIGNPQGRPCPCWVAVSLHSGHCCLRSMPLVGPAACPHEDEGRAIAARALKTRASVRPWQHLADYYPPPPWRAI